LVKDIPSRKLPFTSCKTAPHLQAQQLGAVINQESIHLRGSASRPGKIKLTDIRVHGRHNQENIAAASLATLASGGNMQGILQALKSFKGLPHRLEYVDTVAQVTFFNDSKATNVDAVVQALASFRTPVILISGGRNKGGHFQTLKSALHSNIKSIFLLGEAKHLIQKALKGSAPIKLVDSMQEAVFKSYAAASPGDIILLSPGCASFDMYDNYKERGEDFRTLVAEIKQKKT
jgi:UDP-N-acetylmuramoylalanine--D-glutamate ligase